MITGGGIPQIDPHARIHEGTMFHASKVFTSVANNSTAMILVKVGANKVLHFISFASSEGKMYLDFYETPTITDNGTAITAYNKRRPNATSTDATIFHTPTISGNGTKIHENLVGGNTGGNQADFGGSSLAESEWNLTKNTNYLLIATNKSGSSMDIGMWLDYYEGS